MIPSDNLLEEAWGALNFILAFYEPQSHLDTNAWKQAEAQGRRVHKELREAIDKNYTIIKKEELDDLKYFAWASLKKEELDDLKERIFARNYKELCK